MQIFGRAFELIVGPSEAPTRVTGLRATFSVVKTIESKPNTCDVRIWNLASATRSFLQTKDTAVYLLAGYGAELSQLFFGHARTVDHVQEKADIITRIQCGDGELAGRQRFTESFGKGTKLVEVVTGLAKKMGINTGNIDTALAQSKREGFEEFPHGYTVAGRAVDEFDRLMTAAGFTWSIQDGVLQVLKKTEALPDEAILLSPSSGLIGSPAHGTPNESGEPPALKCKSLLRPGFNPGRSVALESRSVTGFFRVEKVTQTGDTAGGDWYSELELKEVEQKKAGTSVFGWRRWK